MYGLHTCVLAISEAHHYDVSSLSAAIEPVLPSPPTNMLRTASAAINKKCPQAKSTRCQSFRCGATISRGFSFLRRGRDVASLAHK